MLTLPFNLCLPVLLLTYLYPCCVYW